MQKLIIFGTGHFAEISHYYFSNDSDYKVIAFTVDNAYLKEENFKGLPIIPFEIVEQVFDPKEHHIFVALGFHKMNQIRAAKVSAAKAKGYTVASFISSKADVASDLQIYPNTMIMERVGIQPFVKIGENTIIWSTTRIGFHTQIGSHCWLVCPIMGESVRIGDYSFLGLNSCIAPSLTLGKRNVIGAGALILKDTQDDQVYRGHASQPSKVPSSRLLNF